MVREDGQYHTGVEGARQMRLSVTTRDTAFFLSVAPRYES